MNNGDAAGQRKGSLVVAGHPTSISLEPVYWDALREIAGAEGKSLNRLAGEIDATRTGNLSSAVRVFILNWFRTRVGEPMKRESMAKSGKNFREFQNA